MYMRAAQRPIIAIGFLYTCVTALAPALRGPGPHRGRASAAKRCAHRQRVPKGTGSPTGWRATRTP